MMAEEGDRWVVVVQLDGVNHALTIAEAERVRDEITRQLATAAARRRSSAGRIAPGVTVEWDSICGAGPLRATVHRIEDGRVYVRRLRRPTSTNQKPYIERYFEPHEIGKLRVVT